MRNRVQLLLLVVLVALGWLLFIWPTPYRALTIHEPSDGSVAAARINRFTGRVQWLERGQDRFR